MGDRGGSSPFIRTKRVRVEPLGLIRTLFFVFNNYKGLERVGIGNLKVGESRYNCRQKVDTHLLLPRRDSRHVVVLASEGRRSKSHPSHQNKKDQPIRALPIGKIEKITKKQDSNDIIESCFLL